MGGCGRAAGQAPPIDPPDLAVPQSFKGDANRISARAPSTQTRTKQTNLNLSGAQKNGSNVVKNQPVDENV